MVLSTSRVLLTELSTELSISVSVSTTVTTELSSSLASRLPELSMMVIPPPLPASFPLPSRPVLGC